MKIRIIGCSGSGKTWLARRLSEQYGIPHYDLDALQWDDRAETYGVKIPVERRTELLEKILAQEDWIIEGVYYAWVLQSFEDADRIYVLDLPKRVYTVRILKRFLLRKLGLEPGKKETLDSLRKLLAWTDTFQKKNLPEIQTILERYPEKVRCLRTRRDVNRCIHTGMVRPGKTRLWIFRSYCAGDGSCAIMGAKESKRRDGQPL